MKDSRANYKAKRPKNNDGRDGDKSHHESSRYKMHQRNKEVRSIDRAIRTKDYRTLLEQDMD